LSKVAANGSTQLKATAATTTTTIANEATLAQSNLSIGKAQVYSTPFVFASNFWPGRSNYEKKK
jgi:hypothetical protein